MGPTFSPKSISGLKVWLDVSNYASLTFNGSAVSQINDLSGNGFHATQSTGSLQPTYVSTAINGKPAVNFNGSQTQKLTTGATIADYVNTPTTNPQFTFLAVWKIPGLVTDGYTIAWGSDANANGRVFFNTFYGGGNMLFDVVSPSSGRLTATLTKSNYDNAAIVLTGLKNGATMSVRRNGNVEATKTTASGNFSATTAKFNVGTADTTGCCAQFAECLLYSGALSSADLSAAERYLGAKWGVTVA